LIDTLQFDLLQINALQIDSLQINPLQINPLQINPLLIIFSQFHHQQSDRTQIDCLLIDHCQHDYLEVLLSFLSIIASQ